MDHRGGGGGNSALNVDKIAGEPAVDHLPTSLAAVLEASRLAIGDEGVRHEGLGVGTFLGLRVEEDAEEIKAVVGDDGLILGEHIRKVLVCDGVVEAFKVLERRVRVRSKSKIYIIIFKTFSSLNRII